MDYSVIDDEELVWLIARSQPEALSELYDRYSRLVFSLALNILGDQANAEDVTQDVFFRVWEKAKTYQREQAKVSTWLTSIARYRAIDILRRQGARPEGHRVGWGDLNSIGAQPLGERKPEEMTEQSILAQKVRMAISDLPAGQQQALVLAFFQGYTHSEIAKETSMPLGTVKTRIRLAMQKLRDLLREEQVVS